MKFYLGTHVEGWLARFDVPLFVSRRRLATRRTLPRAVGPWALDSGGFTELNMFGRWSVTPAQYASEVRRFRDEIGGLEWAAPQDWMNEPAVRARTGLTVAEHQQRTTDNLLDLRTIDAALPFVPVLQGWERDDYLRHADQYAARGVDLQAEPLVGVGTVCRRQNTAEVERILTDLADLDIRLHAFGAKLGGIARCCHVLESADSLAWSFGARYAPPMTGCHHGKTGAGSCANCPRYALAWRQKVLAVIANPPTRQLALL